MHRPVHPGETLRVEVIEPAALSVTDAAGRLGMLRVALSRVLNGKAGISAELALRLEQAGAGAARDWLARQADHDLWQLRQQAAPAVRPLLPAA